MTSRLHMTIAVAVAMISGALVWALPGSTAQEQHKAQQVADSAHAAYTSRDFVGNWTCGVTTGGNSAILYKSTRSIGKTSALMIYGGRARPAFEIDWSYAASGPSTGVLTIATPGVGGAQVDWLSRDHEIETASNGIHSARYDCVRGQHLPPMKASSKDCAEVKQFIQASEHFRDEYNDPSLIAQAKKNHWTGGQFEDAVHAKDQADAKAIGEEGGTPGATTDANCVIHFNWAAIKQAGLLQVEINSLKVHEEVHQSDCLKAKKNGTDQNTWQFEQKTENDAYTADIAYLQKWVSANC